MNDKNHDSFFDEHSQDQQASQDLLQMINDFEQKTPANIKVGSKVTGTVSRIGSEFIFVDIGGKNEAMIKKTELTGENGEVTVKENDKVTAYVVSNNDDETVLSKSISGHSSSFRISTMHSTTKFRFRESDWCKYRRIESQNYGTQSFLPDQPIDVKFTEDVNSYLARIGCNDHTYHRGRKKHCCKPHSSSGRRLKIKTGGTGKMCRTKKVSSGKDLQDH
jgi:small subunit ribosomal protein S1